MQLKELTAAVAYISTPVNIGVIKTDQGVILIDSGLDDETGARIVKILEKNNLWPIAVINTHSHADHCGGNSQIKEKTGAKIICPAGEEAMVENTLFEPLFFYGGAAPIGDLKNKFLMAPPSSVDRIIEREETRLTIGGEELAVLPLPGHALNQLGFVYQGVCFCGDAYISQPILKRHRIPFNIDIAAQKETLRFLLDSDYDLYLPAHGELAADIEADIRANLERIEEVEKFILKILHRALTTEEVMGRIFKKFDLKIKKPQQYYLNSTGVRAFLAHLYNMEEIEIIFMNNMLYWQK